MACTHIDSCELFVQFALNPALDISKSAYCNGDYRSCVRYETALEDQVVPLSLLPNGKKITVHARFLFCRQAPAGRGRQLDPRRAVHGRPRARLGWAMTGACTSIALVQLGEGKLGALLTIFGSVTGVWIYRAIAAPNFRLDTGICG